MVKLFWRIFFVTIIISITCFSIGSYILINLGFRDTLRREISSVSMENEMLRYSLSQQMSEKGNLYFSWGQYNDAVNEITKEDILRVVAMSIKIYVSNQEVLFRITNNEGKMIYDEVSEKLPSTRKLDVDIGTKAYEVIQGDGNYYIHMIAPYTLEGDLFYIENFREITQVFLNRNNQYRIYIYITIIMLIVIAITMLITSWLLTKPINQLAKSARKMAKGEFGELIELKSYEEIRELEKSFNMMATNLDEMITKLKDANNRQEAFIGSFAHEVKTPLTSMIGYSDILRSKKVTNEQVVLFANYIYEEGKRIESLSMKLLEIIILKHQTISVKKVEVKTFLEEIQGIVYPMFEKAKIELIIEAEEGQVNIEPDLMKTVFINLLDNARKSIQHSVGKVILRGINNREKYSIQIEDNGRGIEKEELSRITEAFYRVDKSRARAEGGVGLGLAICSEIIVLHDASMRFQSQVGQGTCVTIELERC